MSFEDAFASDLGFEMAGIVVRAVETVVSKYKVHKKLLVSKSNYFKEALKDRKEVNFQDEDPIAVRLLVCFLYQGTIPALRPEINGKSTSFLWTPTASADVNVSSNRSSCPPFQAVVEAEPSPPSGQHSCEQIVFQSICSMPEYRKDSPEELRLGDYLASRRYSNAVWRDAFGRVMPKDPTPPTTQTHVDSVKTLPSSSPFSPQSSLVSSPAPATQSIFSRGGSAPPPSLFTPRSTLIPIPVSVTRNLLNNITTSTRGSPTFPEWLAARSLCSDAAASAPTFSSAVTASGGENNLYRKPNNLSQSASTSAVLALACDSFQITAASLTLLNLCLLAEQVSWPALFNAAIRNYAHNESTLGFHRATPCMELIYNHSKANSPLRKMAIDSLGKLGPGQSDQMYMAMARRNEGLLADMILKINSGSSWAWANKSFVDCADGGVYDFVE